VGVVGWSSGAQWALLVSMATPVEATVVYVDVLETDAKRFAHLKGPVLAHLGDQDTFEAEAERFEAKMEEAGRSLTVYWYAASHNFLWPGEPSYKEDLAETAWSALWTSSTPTSANRPP
jgi:carboxymethylenebutenolidase